MAGRGGLRRHCRALPIPARPSKQPGGHQHRSPPFRFARRALRLARIHDAVCTGDDPFRLRRDKLREACRFAVAAWPQDRCGRGCRAGRVGNGKEFVSRSQTRHDCRRCHNGSARGSVSPRSDWRDRCRRADRVGAFARWFGALRRGALGGSPAACAVRRRSRGLLHSAIRVTATRRTGSVAGYRTPRLVLPLRSTGIRRRPRCIAAIARSGRTAGMGNERRLSSRLWRSAGSARAVVYVRRLSWHRDGSTAQWLGRRGHLCLSDFPPVVSALDRRVTVLGHAAPPPRGAIGVARHQRCRRRSAPSGALHTGLDQRHSRSRGFCDWRSGVSAVGAVDGPALGRRDFWRRCGNGTANFAT